MHFFTSSSTKVSTKAVGQRLGQKKYAAPIPAPSPNVAAVSLSLGIPLLPLDVAQQRRDISHREIDDLIYKANDKISLPIVEEGEVGWRQCGGFTRGCTLIPLAIAQADKDVARRMFM